MTRILTLDIETSPHEGYAFDVWGNNMTPDKIIQPTAMLSFAAKWRGDPQSRTVYRSYFETDMHDQLYRMMNDADMIVGYNHDKFDLRHINRELVERGYKPPRPVPTVDLLKVVKKRFNFPHYRLDYVASVLLGEKKLETGGFDLWPAFMAQDPKALRVMKRYNIKDTVLTEKLYDRLLPWIPNHPYLGGGDIIIDDADVVYECPTCENKHNHVPDQRRTRCFTIRVNQCGNCGTWFDGRRKKIA